MRVYRQAMLRDEDEKAAIRALVESTALAEAADKRVSHIGHPADPDFQP